MKKHTNHFNENDNENDNEKVTQKPQKYAEKNWLSPSSKFAANKRAIIQQLSF